MKEGYFRGWCDTRLLWTHPNRELLQGTYQKTDWHSLLVAWKVEYLKALKTLLTNWSPIKGWVTRVFAKWFHTRFIAAVNNFSTDHNLPAKAISKKRCFRRRVRHLLPYSRRYRLTSRNNRWKFWWHCRTKECSTKFDLGRRIGWKFRSFDSANYLQQRIIPLPQ